MKDYLRLQYNNAKNHNFILICSEILTIFSKEKNVQFIYKYYLIIISLIDFLIKSCSGQCKGNQDCIVKHEGILNLIQFILKHNCNPFSSIVQYYYSHDIDCGCKGNYTAIYAWR